MAFFRQKVLCLDGLRNRPSGVAGTGISNSHVTGKEAITVKKQLLGKCGFYCGACPTYIQGRCRGCEKEHTAGDCFTRDCVKEKKLSVCGACEAFPCETIRTKPHCTVLDKDWLRWKKEEGNR